MTYTSLILQEPHSVIEICQSYQGAQCLLFCNLSVDGQLVLSHSHCAGESKIIVISASDGALKMGGASIYMSKTNAIRIAQEFDLRANCTIPEAA